MFNPGDLYGFHLKNNKEITFKPSFGVYGNSQLPRFVFVGPLPANRVENYSPQPCMILISRTKSSMQSDSACSNNPSVKSTEATKPSSTMGVQSESEVFVPSENINQKYEQSNCAAFPVPSGQFRHTI